MINLAAIVDHHASRRPDKAAVVWNGQSQNYRELLKRVNAAACGLRDLGIRRGDVVALLMQNRPEFIELIFAINRLGAVFLPLNFRLAPAEWLYMLENSAATALVAETEFADLLTEAATPSSLRVRLVVDEVGRVEHESYQSLVAANAGATCEPIDLAEGDLQRLMYTSGTTAHPKGVCITHGNFAWKTLSALVEFGWTHHDITAVGGPMYHVGALDMGGLTTLYAGGTLVLQSRFRAEEFLALIEQYRATNCWLAPSMVNAILQCPDIAERDLSSLKLILSGGEKMPEARLRQILEILPQVWFADSYGLTETVSTDTVMDQPSMQSKIGSVGRPLPHQELRIVDERGGPAGAGELGEIVIRGPKVFAGYWRDPHATESAIQAGWFHTGDIGRLDDDGYLYIEDRKKDMIVSGGENVASPEIEGVLYEHAAVLEVAVVAHADERWGEVPHAYVVTRADSEVTAIELSEFCRTRLARFKVPSYFDFVDELPRTPSGKVLKRALRARHDQRTDSAHQ